MHATPTFEFATSDHILFGAGVSQTLGARLTGLGHTPLLVTGRTLHRAQPVITHLQAAGQTWRQYPVIGEPTLETVREGVALARDHNCDYVIAVGGGSVLDAGKAIAALLTNPGDPLDYLEIIGRGRQISRPAAPFVAIPTTAGTGSEVTRNAVLFSPEHRLKVSLRSPHMLPTLAVVDPELTLSLPPALTATTGLDALTQLIEPFVSNRANPLTDALCREGIRRAARSLRVAAAQPHDLAARTDMALASLFGGLALANAKLGAVHGFAGPFGGMFQAPHGGICAALLPHVVAVNVRALRTRSPGHPILARYDELGCLLTNDAAAGADDAVVWLQQLCADLQIPGLAVYGLAEKHFHELIDKARRSSSMQGNPISLTDEELRDILRMAL
ncbi:MAG: iron-containing alcohol dehydrogenase [Caldilineae bacterium]|nr:MAG: iron-containing alcohol dehydrogenase [Caldilineae bacterium]